MPILVIVLIALICSPMSVGAQNQPGLSIKQKTKFAPEITVLSTKDSFRIKIPKRKIWIEAFAPDWDVFTINKAGKRYYKTSWKDYKPSIYHSVIMIEYPQYMSNVLKLNETREAHLYGKPVTTRVYLSYKTDRRAYINEFSDPRLSSQASSVLRKLYYLPTDTKGFPLSVETQWRQVATRKKYVEPVEIKELEKPITPMNLKGLKLCKNERETLKDDSLESDLMNLFGARSK